MIDQLVFLTGHGGLYTTLRYECILASYDSISRLTVIGSKLF
jgi:hypothetical protein